MKLFSTTGVLSAVSLAAFAAAALATSSAFAVAQTCTWVGTSGKFSSAANWSNCGSGAPKAGDIIRFADFPSPSLNYTLTNDLNVELGGMVVAASGTTTMGGFPNYELDSLSLADGGYIDVEAAGKCQGALKIGIGSITSTGSITTNTEVATTMGIGKPTASNKYTVAGNLTVKNQYGTAYMNATAGSTAGSITVMSPTPYSSFCAPWDGFGGRGAAPNGPDDALSNFQYGSLTLQKGALISLGSTYSKPITVAGGTGTRNAKILYWPLWNDDFTYPLDSNVVLSGAMTLSSSLDIYVGPRATARVKGALSGSGKVVKSSDAEGQLIIESTTNTSGTSSGTVTLPTQKTVISDKSTKDISAVQNETVVLEGSRGSVFVANSGTLKGAGTIGYRLYVDVGGIVAPGNSPGCLTAGTLQINGEYQVDLGGTDPCTGYDQIKVTDTAAATPVMLDSATAVLTTTRFNDYTPKQNQVFVIIDNQNGKPVSGTFKGLAEGATFEQNGVVFKISYKGGDGNDVTLTVQNIPAVPNTGVMIIKSNPTMIAGVAVVAALLLVGAARFASRRS